MEYREFLTKEGARASLLGFGGMRFPLNRATRKLDEGAARALIQRAMEGGVTYYDTAWPYHEGESEPFLGRTLSAYPRDSYFLATKLPCWEIESLQQAKELFARQQERLQTDYFDCYLLHSLSGRTWEKMVSLGVVEWLEQRRAEGAIHAFGFSFHDTFQVFRQILEARCWDFCQIQLNYMDAEYQAGVAGCRLAESMGVPVVVMEPVKGGSLAQLPVDVTVELRRMAPTASHSSWAMRWVGSEENVKVILSGMTTLEQLEDNLKTFSPLRVLDPEERLAVEETARRLRARVKNGCTGCGYCMPCPAGVDIPKSFRIWNNMAMYQNSRLTRFAWRSMDEDSRPDRCYGCGRCERLCPQHLPIRSQLRQIRDEVEAFTGLNHPN